MPQAAWLVAGPPGSGKSTFIKNEAQRRGYKLLHWNARLDRSLRDGRDRLHVQVRSKEASLLWIEGVEDLTQEAQAFLRRILETATPQVLCVLESTEPWRIAAPVLSRCIYKEIKQKNPLTHEKALPALETLLQEWEYGEDPVSHLSTFLTSEILPKDLQLEAYRRWGNGASPWILLAWVTAELKSLEMRSIESTKEPTHL
jgi:DNA polymerase III delta prime subunit